jgi:iron complex outermembrane receptor protein
MKLNRVHAAVIAALTGVTGLPYQTAFAQGGLEEIVVTATRREESLQEVPISIVAITGEGLEMRGLDSLEDMGKSVPNMVITGGGAQTGLTSFRVRGIPNVGTYIDNVWQVGTNGFLTQELVDIDRIEILRGPQGTMFGRDSTGGALRIWTKRPSEEMGADVTATIGSYDRRDVKASLDLPISDTLRTKWTAASMYRDGYVRSLTTNQRHGGIDQQVFRGDIVWEPSDKLDFRLNYQDNEMSFTDPRVQDAIYDTFDQFRLTAALPEFYGLAGAEPFNRENQLAGYPGGRVGKWENRSEITVPNTYITEQISLETNWHVTDSISVQFLTATAEQDSTSYIDYDSSQYALVNDLSVSNLEVFSQEMQITGGGDRIQWVGGLYYWDQRTLTRGARWLIEEFRLGQLDVNTAYASAQCQNPPTGFPPPAFATCQQTFAGALAGPSGPFDTLGRAEVDGFAIFGEVTINLTDTLELTAGVRQHDQNGDNWTLYPIAGVTAPKPSTVNMLHNGNPLIGTDIIPAGLANAGNPSPRNPYTFDKLTSRLVLSKQFNDDFMGYVSYSEGFNSGGVSVATVQNVRQFYPFEPSTLLNFEVGVRSDLADGRVRFNATLFHTTWEDIQALGAVLDPVTGTQLPTLLTTNIGEAEAKGAEFELTFLATDNLTFNFNLGLLDTGYTKLPPGQTSGHVAWTTDTEFQQAPDTTYSIGLRHNKDLANGGTWTSALEYNYQAQFWRQDPFLRMSAYDGIPPGEDESGDSKFLNLRFTYEPADANYQLAIFGTNLLDEYLINTGFFHGIWGFDFATVARPREAGASLTFRF